MDAASSAVITQVSHPSTNPNPNSNSDPSSSQSYVTTTSYDSYYHQSYNSDRGYTNVYTQPWPPGVEANPSLTQQPVTVEAPYTQALTFDPNFAANAAAMLYYGDHSTGSGSIWNDAVKKLADPSAAAGVSTTFLVNQFERQRTQIKYAKKMKIVQSAWCEVCRICCTSENVLRQHKLGKKHKKNLEKSQVLATTVHANQDPSAHLLAHTFIQMQKPIIGPEEKQTKSETICEQKSQKKAAEKEDLEVKKRKLLDGGAAADAVRICNICNVVCNSEMVFTYHLVGKKHTSMIKKHVST